MVQESSIELSFLNERYLPCKFLEISDEIVDLIASGKCTELYIRGGDPVNGLEETCSHLIAGDSSYSLTNVHTSNSMLFAIGDALDESSGTVIENAGSYLELEKKDPMMYRDQLVKFIRENDCTRASLELYFPLSRRQLDNLLTTVGVFENTETQKLSVLPLHQITELLAYILNSAVVEGMSFESIKFHVLERVAKADGIPETDVSIALLKHILTLVSVEKEDNCYAIDRQKVCFYYGLQLLSKIPGRLFTTREFLAEWSQSLPIRDEFSVDLAILNGFHVKRLDEVTRTEYIAYIKRESLSLKPRTRLQQLFELQPKWYEDDLVVLFKDLIPQKAKLDSFLLKFTRTNRLSDFGILYSSRLN